jgi:four helix bundle protein
MKSGNIIQEKSYLFALKVIKIGKILMDEKKEYILSKQLVRSGTAIGALVEEAIGGQSEKDFFSKMSIAYKEARETHYWIRLLRDSEYLESHNSKELLKDVDELQKIIGSIQKSLRSRIETHVIK